MLKGFFRSCIIFILLSINAWATNGNLFKIIPSGNKLPTAVSFTLCLNINGKFPLSCQTYTSNQANLSISTTVPNHTYKNAGIKINTPGYTYAPTYSSNGDYFFLGVLSDSQANNGGLSSPNMLKLTAIPSVITEVGGSYSQTNVASGGTTPYSYSLSSGLLPAGTMLYRARSQIAVFVNRQLC